MKPTGYILLHKQITENCLWEDKPFARGQAWIDLILMANFKDGEMFTKGTIVPVKRGQVFRTIKFLSNRWGWSIKKTKGFLTLLENQKMVTTKGLPQGTLITIEKYESFQTLGTSKEPSQGISWDHQGTTKELQKNKERIKNKEETIKDIYSSECSEIVDYLNEMCGTSYRSSSRKTRSLIEARLKEGFTVEDFKTVIYKKGKQWMGDTKMCKFLRPETLFSNKFEGYLNEKDVTSVSRWDVMY